MAQAVITALSTRLTLKVILKTETKIYENSVMSPKLVEQFSRSVLFSVILVNLVPSYNVAKSVTQMVYTIDIFYTVEHVK